MNDQALFASALFNPELSAPTGLSTWNSSDPALRFAVYRNNVIVSLVDAMADTFPVTQALVGEEFFRAMARVFIQAHPVKTRVLAWMGAAFADFIETFAPAASLAYLADLARLEMLRVRAYHAADVPALELQALSLVLTRADALSNLRLLLHPSVFLLQSRYAVYSLWAAHQGELSIETVNPDLAQAVLVFRRELDVEVLHLSAAQAHFVQQLAASAALAVAANEAAQQDPEFDLSSSLATLIQQQLITGFRNGDTHHDTTSLA